MEARIQQAIDEKQTAVGAGAPMVVAAFGNTVNNSPRKRRQIIFRHVARLLRFGDVDDKAPESVGRQFWLGVNVREDPNNLVEKYERFWEVFFGPLQSVIPSLTEDQLARGFEVQVDETHEGQIVRWLFNASKAFSGDPPLLVDGAGNSKGFVPTDRPVQLGFSARVAEVPMTSELREAGLTVEHIFSPGGEAPERVFVARPEGVGRGKGIQALQPASVGAP